MRTMNFVGDGLHPGLNLTVRAGGKWADLKAGEPIRIHVCSVRHKGDCSFAQGCGGEGPAAVVGVWHAADVHAVPESLMRFERVAAARDRAGLNDALCAAYGPAFDENGLTLVLIWWPL